MTNFPVRSHTIPTETGFSQKARFLFCPFSVPQAHPKTAGPSVKSDTTEHAAYGVAFLLIRDLTDHTIIRISRKGTGFDYWIGREESEDGLPFQDKARLEVSGIRRGNSADVNARLRQKLSQVKPSDHLGIPAYIVIVEFGIPSSKVVRK